MDNSSVIEIDFIRSDIFEEVLNYMYTSKISVKKRDVNLMMSSGQILGIRFLDKLCSQVALTLLLYCDWSSCKPNCSVCAKDFNGGV